HWPPSVACQRRGADPAGLRSTVLGANLPAVPRYGGKADLWRATHTVRARGTRPRIPFLRHLESVQAERISGSLQPAARIQGIRPERLRRLAAQGGRPRAAPCDVLARRIARASFSHPNHAARLRRRLELHRSMEGRAAFARARSRRLASRSAL